MASGRARLYLFSRRASDEPHASLRGGPVDDVCSNVEIRSKGLVRPYQQLRSSYLLGCRRLDVDARVEEVMVPPIVSPMVRGRIDTKPVQAGNCELTEQTDLVTSERISIAEHDSAIDGVIGVIAALCEFESLLDVFSLQRDDW